MHVRTAGSIAGQPETRKLHKFSDTEPQTSFVAQLDPKTESRLVLQWSDVFTSPTTELRLIALDVDTDAVQVLRDTENGLSGRAIDVITFTSASTVCNFHQIVADRWSAIAGNVVVAVIGPVARQACIDLGIEVQVMPSSYTLPHLVEALARHYGQSDS